MSDNTYPKEETGRDELTGNSIAMHLDKQSQRAHRAFSNSPPARLPFPQQNKWQVFRHRKPPRWKNEEQNSARDDLSCSVLSGVSNSFRFLVEHFSQWEALGLAEFLTGILSGVCCCNLHTEKPGDRGSRGRLWAGRKAAGLHREQGPGHNPALSQR